MIANPLYVLAVLCLSVVVSEWLVRHSFLRHLGTALLVIIAVAILANVGLLPAASEGSPVYVGVFRYLAPLSIFYLLLDVNLASIRRAGFPMLLLFVVGSFGTAAGVLAASWLLNGAEHFGEFHAAIGGMFTGTYSGGSVNFNAVAIHYNVMEEGVLYAGMTAVDNIMTALWMVATLAIPLFLRRAFPRKPSQESLAIAEEVERETEPVSVLALGILLALGFAVLLVSNLIADWTVAAGFPVPSILILTTIALVLAQIPAFHGLVGGQVLGLFCVYLFLAVIGAFCELAALAEIGPLAWRLLALVTITVFTHGLLVFGLAAAGRFDWDTAAVASQANVGGSSSALALAKSLGRMDLYLPGILVGALGNGLGTYLGFLVAGILGG